MNNITKNNANNNAKAPTEETFEAKVDFYDHQLDRAKTLLNELTRYTSGVFVPPDEPQWSMPYLLELFKIFMLVEDVWQIGDFVNDLENHLFSESFEFDAKKDDWAKSKLFPSADLTRYGAQTQPPAAEQLSKPAPLNLSEICTEFLGTNDSSFAKLSEAEQLACQISAIIEKFRAAGQSL